MAEWRAGRSVGRTLYVDDKLVGLVDTPELAAEIVETMNRVGRLLDEVRAEATIPWANAVTCGHCGRVIPLDGGGRFMPHTTVGDDPTGDWCEASRKTPCRGCGRTSHGFACTAQLEAAQREQDQLSRVDPYDTTKGGVVDSVGETHAVSWEEFDTMVDRTRAKATRWALCPRCSNRQALDRYGRITVHARAETAAEREVCPGTGEMTL